jgi:hypothetical protein
MSTRTGLIVVAIGAILAFAVRSTPSWFNIQIAGLVIMLTGLVGMVVSRRRDYGKLLHWLRARSTAGEPKPEPRAIDPTQVYSPSAGAGAPSAEARPSADGAAEARPSADGAAADGAAADSTVPGAAEHAEGAANEHPRQE